MVWTPSTSTTNATCLPDSVPRASSRYVRTPVTRTSLTSYSPGPSSTNALSRLDGRRVRPSRECLPLPRGRGRSSGWLNVTTSPVIPRPVGPTTDWNGSLTTTASLPRNRTQVRPYQVSSIRSILTQRSASALHATGSVGRLESGPQPRAVGFRHPCGPNAPAFGSFPKTGAPPPGRRRLPTLEVFSYEEDSSRIPVRRRPRPVGRS